MGKRRASVGATGALVGVVALLSACGGGNGGASRSDGGGDGCLQVSACGGSLIGTWTVQSSCEALILITAGFECPGTTLDESMLVTSGTLTYNADLTYTSNVTWSGTLRWKLDVACIGFPDCETYVTAKNTGQGPGTSCTTVSGTFCDCAYVYSVPDVVSDSGTYTTSGNMLTSTSSKTPLNPYSRPYCVQGNELHLLTEAGLPAPTADLVATK